MNVDRSDRILCADTSEAPIHELRVDGWGFIHRAYRETAMNASEGALDSATLAAAMVPILLTPKPRSPSTDTGATCRNHLSSTRCDSCTTTGHRS